MKQPNTTVYNTALYLRLSRDDEGVGESNSISTQRMMLRRYADQNGLIVIDEYIDDGYSGTNFNRPAFQRMITDIEAGHINCVVVKDLSRFGRNYLEMGLYTEMRFPEMGVRFIAVDSGVDSNNQQTTEFTPFLNVINEWYARDISRKVTKAFRTRHENGAHYGAYAPLGYKKDPEQTGHLLVDDETKWIVAKIFDLAIHGAGPPRLPMCWPLNRCLPPVGSTSSDTALLPTSTRTSQKADSTNGPFHRSEKSCRMKRISGIAYIISKLRYHSSVKSE